MLGIIGLFLLLFICILLSMILFSCFLPCFFSWAWLDKITYFYICSILPALAFSLDMFDKTHQSYGVNEVLLASVLGSVVFSFFAAQPLAIVGITGMFMDLLQRSSSWVDEYIQARSLCSTTLSMISLLRVERTSLPSCAGLECKPFVSFG